MKHVTYEYRCGCEDTQQGLQDDAHPDFDARCPQHGSKWLTITSRFPDDPLPKSPLEQ